MAEVGSEANAWKAVAAGVGATSALVDVRTCRSITVMGNASAATTISVQVSQDGVTFYDALAPTQILAGAGNFGFTFDCAAGYVRLKTSAAATITATIAGR